MQKRYTPQVYDLSVREIARPAPWQTNFARQAEGRVTSRKKQVTGLRVASALLEHMGNDELVDPNVVRMLAAATLGTSWYAFCYKAMDANNRRTQLPRLGIDEFLTVPLMAGKTGELLSGRAAGVAGLEITPFASQTDEVQQARHRLGHALATISYHIGAIPQANIIRVSDDFNRRLELVHDVAIDTVLGMHDLRERLHCDPTLDQLSSVNSPLTNEIATGMDTATQHVLETALRAGDQQVA